MNHVTNRTLAFAAERDAVEQAVHGCPSRSRRASPDYRAAEHLNGEARDPPPQKRSNV
jgi:hypothetical protein